MPEYLYPGVYVEEIDTGNKPIEGVSTSTVGFLGVAERGPAVPTFLTSFGDYRRSFGGYVKETIQGAAVDRYLAYAVEGFFTNGGLRCFVQRVFHKDPQQPSNSAQTATKVADQKMEIDAIGPGAWGNRVAYSIDKAGLKDDSLFKLTILYWSDTPPADFANPGPTSASPSLTEVFDNLSAVPSASTFYESEINGLSNLVTVKQVGPGSPAKTAIPAVPPSPANPQGTPAQPNNALLTSGSDGTIVPGDFQGDATDPENKTGLEALADIDEISILCCPDEFYFNPTDTTISQYLVDQCELLKYRFAILQAPVKAPAPGFHNPSIPSKYAAYYYPWLYIVSPTTGTQLLIPPGGQIAGIYARSDTNRGVQKDPANEQILGIDHLQLQINNGQQAILNPLGVNCLRYFKGQGNLVWGGRTTIPDPDWKYISVRRLFIFVEKSIQNGTQWVVFEPNDAPLWARVIRSVSDFLTGLWKNGMLQGQTKEQAYFVRCDRTTMTQADIDNGRLIMVIGIAPLKPAEFVIFRIGQWTGGSDVTEG
jgi:phage tail sheath protein FI